jgi:hypothetical protein
MNTLALAILAVVLTALGRFIYKAYLWRRHAATLASQQYMLNSRSFPTNLPPDSLVHLITQSSVT